MNCNQCEQVSGTACTKIGVCGKNPDVQSLHENLIYALKGISAYAYHARELGATDPQIDAFLAEGLYTTLTNVNFDLQKLVALNLKAGEITIQAMKLLRQAHVDALGKPQPVTVPTGTAAGPGILVTGHNMQALLELLKQTEGTGISIYTHSEMLPAHGYPLLHAFPHLKANLGTSWIDQREVFATFPGAIVGTTNCVLIPRPEYQDRMFTLGITALPGVTHIEGYDFTPVIKKALALPPCVDQPSDLTLTAGFSDSNILPMAGAIIEAVKAGKIRHFFLVGGCDAPGLGGNYYRELVASTPADTVILTLGCGKYRFNDLDLGDINGIPRLLDLGQCNDAIAAIEIATALAQAFECSVNDLPLTLVLSWMEQKAVAILMGLFSLGVHGIYLGPKPPAWITPNVLAVIQENFDLRFTGDPHKDLATILGTEEIKVAQ